MSSCPSNSHFITKKQTSCAPKITSNSTNRAQLASSFTCYYSHDAKCNECFNPFSSVAVLRLLHPTHFGKMKKQRCACVLDSSF